MLLNCLWNTFFSSKYNQNDAFKQGKNLLSILHNQINLSQLIINELMDEWMDYEGKKFLNIFKSVFQESISVLIVCESRSGDEWWWCDFQ